MTTPTPPDDIPNGPGPASGLERLTGLVLVAVLAAVGGMVYLSYRGAGADDVHPLTGPLEVAGACVLLFAALGLVSLVALRHTR